MFYKKGWVCRNGKGEKLLLCKKEVVEMAEKIQCMSDIYLLQDLLQETQIPQKELVRALQSLALGKPQQRVLIQLHRKKDSSVKDFGKL